MYKLYLFTDFDSIDESFLQKCMTVLPPERKTKALRYRFATDRKMCVVSYLLLLYALRENYGIQNPKLGCSKNGKPYLTEYPEIHFNISHCPKGCICAVSDREIGVDIQDVRPFSWNVAKQVCCENELKLLHSSDDKDKMFTQIWAMKESILKLSGMGIAGMMKIDVTVHEREIKFFWIQNCAVSVANEMF